MRIKYTTMENVFLFLVLLNEFILNRVYFKENGLLNIQIKKNYDFFLNRDT